MINWWLIALATIMSIAIVALAVYIVILFISEEDAAGGYLPKAIVILGLSLACIAVLMLPFDVASRVSPTNASFFDLNDINTPLMWQIILWLVFSFSIVVVPFVYFYYESYDPDSSKALHQIPPAVGFTCLFLVIVAILVGVLWHYVGEATIEYRSYSIPLQKILMIDDANMIYEEQMESAEITVRVSIFVYMVAVMCFLGWVLFFIYGGIGIVAFPIDQIGDFIKRPKAISAAEFAREMDVIAVKAKVLLSAADALNSGRARGNINHSTKKKINIIRNETYVLEKHLDIVVYAYEKAGGSPFWLAAQVLSGALGAIISCFWIMHIFIFQVANVHPFLNTMLTELDHAFSLLGVLAYAILSFYLLLCTIKGQIKFGMRFVIFKIHPMKIGDTMLNAMLFNVGLILLSSIAVIQFCTNSFSVYANNTSIDGLLNLYVRRLKGIGPAIQYMQFLFVAVAILSIIWLIACPRKKTKGSIYKSMAK